jgi:cytochrome c oxidase subunit 1
VAVRSLTQVHESVFADNPAGKVSLFFLVTGLAALLVGALLGPFQALNYAGVNFYWLLQPLLRSYYQGLSLHGVLNALVFTTYFISGLLLYLTARELDLKPNLGFCWASYWLMTGGLLIAAVGLLTNTSNVLYTFYPPLMGHWTFYTGLALVVVASLMVGYEIVRLRYVWKQANPGKATPIVTYMSVTTYLMWALASVGIVIEVVWFLIPWSLGLREGVDPLLARTLFWYTGHPIVYFWLLPAYVSWYGLMPKQAGGELVSDSLARLAFLMFLLFSTPVGLHHQFTDPGIPAGWKMIHSMLTMFVGIPSMLTAFTVAASLEIGGKRRGGRGMLGWIGKLPWRDAAFTAQILAMIAFVFGGAGGIVNASFNLNVLVHNTAWVPGHFHLTVGSAVALTFFGVTFWLIPHLVRKPLFSNRLALAASWLWFIGMMFFAVGMHWQGILAVPRRAHISNLAENLQGAYDSARIPQILTGISGVILLLSVIAYFTVLFGTLLSRRRADDAEVPAIPFSSTVEVRSEGITRLMDNLLPWFLIAVFLVIVAYLPTLIYLFMNQVPLPGMRPW